MQIKQHIPNSLTALNLSCGVLAIFAIMQGEVYTTAILVSISLVADFLDGFVARLLGVSSPIGKELDSLADMVTFGVVPGLIMMHLIQKSIPDSEPIFLGIPLFAFAGILVIIFSALRLAKFNVDERQSDTFYGVPTPANTIFIISLWLIAVYNPTGWMSGLIGNTWVLIILCFVLSWLLVADIRLIALKFKDYSFAKNPFRYTLILASIILFAFFQFQAIPFIIILYILLSISKNALSKQTNS